MRASEQFFNTAIISMVIILFSITGAWREAAAGISPIGFIAMSRGNPTIVRRGENLAASAMSLLYIGDIVILNRNDSLRVNLTSGEGYTVNGPAEFTISPGLRFTKGRALKKYSMNRRDCAAAVEVLLEESGGTLLTSGRGERSGAYRLRGRSGENSIALLNTGILSSRPVFAWKRVRDAVHYGVRVRNGEKTLHANGTVTNYYEYPSGAESLSGKEDLCIDITAYGKEGVVITTSVNEFTLRGPEADEKFRKQEASIRGIKDETLRSLLLGRHYESYGLIPSAIEEYERCYGLSNDESIKRKISRLREMTGE